MRKVRKDFVYVDESKTYTIKNVPCEMYQNDEEGLVYSVNVSKKLALLINLMQTNEIKETTLNYEDFAHVDD